MHKHKFGWKFWQVKDAQIAKCNDCGTPLQCKNCELLKDITLMAGHCDKCDTLSDNLHHKETEQANDWLCAKCFVTESILVSK